MGLAIIIPNVSFADANLGKVTIAQDIPLISLSIDGESSIEGVSADFNVVYNPETTNKRGVTWSITSGSDYAEIDQTGHLTIKSTADNSSVTIKVTSTSNASITATKTISVTYHKEPVTFNSQNYTYYRCDQTSDKVSGETSNMAFVSNEYIELQQQYTKVECYSHNSNQVAIKIAYYDDNKVQIGEAKNYCFEVGYGLKKLDTDVPQGAKYFRFILGIKAGLPENGSAVNGYYNIDYKFT